MLFQISPQGAHGRRPEANYEHRAGTPTRRSRKEADVCVAGGHRSGRRGLALCLRHQRSRKGAWQSSTWWCILNSFSERASIFQIGHATTTGERPRVRASVQRPTGNTDIGFSLLRASATAMSGSDNVSRQVSTVNSCCRVSAACVPPELDAKDLQALAWSMQFIELGSCASPRAAISSSRLQCLEIKPSRHAPWLATQLAVKPLQRTDDCFSVIRLREHARAISLGTFCPVARMIPIVGCCTLALYWDRHGPTIFSENAVHERS